MERRTSKPLDAVVHAVALVDGQGNVVNANAAWTRLVRSGVLPCDRGPERRKSPVVVPEHEGWNSVETGRRSPPPSTPHGNIIVGCEQLAEMGWPVAEAIRGVLEGRVTRARHEILVRGTWQHRWLELDISKHERRGARPFAVIQVQDITSAKRAEGLRNVMREVGRSLVEGSWDEFPMVLSRAARPLLEWRVASRWDVRARGSSVDVRVATAWTPHELLPSEAWTRVQKQDVDLVRRAAIASCPVCDETSFQGAPVGVALPCGIETPARSVVLLACEIAPTSSEIGDLGYLFQAADEEDAAALLAGTAPIPLAASERDHLVTLLEAGGGNLRKIARWLGISRSTLYDKLRRYGIPYENRRRPTPDEEAADDGADEAGDSSAA